VQKTRQECVPHQGCCTRAGRAGRFSEYQFHCLPSKDTHVVRGSLLPVHGPCDIHPAGHRVDAKDLHGGLVSAHPCDAVPDGDVVVFVRSDLKGREREKVSACGGCGAVVAIPLLECLELGHVCSA
jgi:hypothetical protein